MSQKATAKRRRVLFLCTGNSCRSQMAEGLARQALDEAWEAFSAGTEPSGIVHPLAIAAMREVGVDISQQQSKSVELFREMRLDLVVTVCDDAAENCPLWLGSGRVVHMGMPDPARATGSEAERIEVFRRVRDQIGEKVIGALRAGSI